MILTEVSGVTFEDAWPARVATQIEGVALAVIGLEDLIQNKRSAARTRDLADVDALERARRRA
jgi:hypothetical protein